MNELKDYNIYFCDKANILETYYNILKNINGNSLSDISQAMRLFETLREERSISMSLERNREDKEFHYQIR